MKLVVSQRCGNRWSVSQGAFAPPLLCCSSTGSLTGWPLIDGVGSWNIIGLKKRVFWFSQEGDDLYNPSLTSQAYFDEKSKHQDVWNHTDFFGRGTVSSSMAVKYLLKLHKLEFVGCAIICVSEAVLTWGVTDGYRPQVQHFSFRDIPLCLYFEHTGFPPHSESSTSLVKITSVPLMDTRGCRGSGLSLPWPPCPHSNTSKGPQIKTQKPSQKKIDQAYDLLYNILRKKKMPAFADVELPNDRLTSGFVITHACCQM